MPPSASALRGHGPQHLHSVPTVVPRGARAYCLPAMCQAASQFSAKVLALWPYCPGSSVLGFHRPACEGSWGLEGHAWGTQHSPWPRLYIWELWFSLYSATSCLRIVAAKFSHGQQDGAPLTGLVLQSHVERGTCLQIPQWQPCLGLSVVTRDGRDGSGQSSLSGSPTK